MHTIESFADFLAIAHAQSLPQTLLFVFTRPELPEGHTAQQARRFEQGEGGHLAPVFSVDKPLAEVSDFNSLATEAKQMNHEWSVVFVAALQGFQLDDQIEQGTKQMVEAIRNGQISSFLPFDTTGTPIRLDVG